MTVPLLHLIRAEIDVPNFLRWAGGARRLVRDDVPFDEGYAMHCLLRESFGEQAPQPFRYFLPRNGDEQRGTLHGYAPVNAECLDAASAVYADPLQQDIFSSLRSRPMPTVWKPGVRLGFETRVRPVVRRSSRAQDRPGQELDVFDSWADNLDQSSPDITRQDAYIQWLAQQFDNLGGASLKHARLRSYRRTPVRRRLRGPDIYGPDAVFQGDLTVTDGEAFTVLLARGIGRHRAYGYGMLQLRPPRADTGP